MTYKGWKSSLLSLLGLLFIVSGLSMAYAQDGYYGDRYDYGRAGACLGNLCVGDSVRVVSGYYNGHSGYIVGIDNYSQVLTVETHTRNYIYPRFGEVMSEYAQVPCLGSVCVGAEAIVMYGYYRGYEGVVTFLNSARYSATLRLYSGGTIEVQVSDLQVRMPRPRPRPMPMPQPRPPHYPRACPPGTAYDPRMGACVGPRPGPRPMPPHHGPYPGPGPHPGPGPGPYPGPGPHPGPGPGGPRGPGPGPGPGPGGPRGPRPHSFMMKAPVDNFRFA